MTRVTLDRVPQVLEPAFAAGDPACDEKPQERANVELLGQMFHAIAQGRFEELRNLLTYDATLEIAAPPRVPWRRSALGPRTWRRPSPRTSARSPTSTASRCRSSPRATR